MTYNTSPYMTKDIAKMLKLSILLGLDFPTESLSPRVYSMGKE